MFPFIASFVLLSIYIVFKVGEPSDGVFNWDPALFGAKFAKFFEQAIDKIDKSFLATSYDTSNTFDDQVNPPGEAKCFHHHCSLAV